MQPKGEMTGEFLLDGVRKPIAHLHAIGAKCELAASSPKPLLMIEWHGDWLDDEFSSSVMFLVYALAETSKGSETCPVVRCVEAERLSLVCDAACDVRPTDSVIWIDKFPSKALEYGGDAKLMMVFDIRCTLATYCKLPSDTDAESLAEARKSYPTIVPSVDGSMLWLSRLPEHDKRVASGYEVEYARWIPNDPFDALIGVFVLSRNMARMKEMVDRCKAECKCPTWR